MAITVTFGLVIHAPCPASPWQRRQSPGRAVFRLCQPPAPIRPFRDTCHNKSTVVSSNSRGNNSHSSSTPTMGFAPWPGWVCTGPVSPRTGRGVLVPVPVVCGARRQQWESHLDAHGARHQAATATPSAHRISCPSPPLFD
ncbi:hypothetical protein PSV08DRAFT_247699 [Bipolaris maydis]|uniref:uncharacterized protein n=1 Tax=Cochliobolus heterostrophus TaxID=5016 RepID=UPI0024D97C58|nr:hypothetical protein J3E73DRAFT_256299 [Bipolaris maydis]KAJ6271026.1 hypothetical protein PSV08DRAFT_247699 [Bipolaris maydis]